MLSRLTYSTLFFVLFILMIHVSAQENYQTNDSLEVDTFQNDTLQESLIEETQEIIPEKEEVPATPESVFAAMSEFPTLHPLVVHFPPAFLLLALFTQLFGLIAKRRAMSFFTIILLLAGFVTAMLAAKVFHPHVTDLPQQIQEVYDTHKYYANATLWLAGIALVLKLISHFILKSKTWAEVVVFLVIGGSAITVGLAGHLGTQMVYIENVGPQGNYLEEHEH